ncbi:MAG: ankyrin repeat domain-containing protein [Candidatus Binatia bacterium]
MPFNVKPNGLTLRATTAEKLIPRGFTTWGRGILLKLMIQVVLGLLVAMGPSLARGADEQPLLTATKHDDLKTVKNLLQAGVNPDVHDAAHNTALIFACRDGHLEIVEALIHSGATVNWVDGEGVTPLILASFRGHVAIAKFLLDHGADRTIKDQWGRTALDYALRRGAEDEISRLLQK